LLFSGAFAVLLNFWVIQNGKSRILTSLAEAPRAEFALVLGSRPNGPAFIHRIAAAYELYENGKVKHIIVSGDNGRVGYNEPVAMKDALLELGVKDADITLDYAGFRTLDSVYRAKAVFGVEEMIVVTQGFHASRAIYLADAAGIKCWAYLAGKGSSNSYNNCREFIARCVCVVDVVCGRGARFSGPRQRIDLKEK
ncbi:MAG: YdcF family protein, partial [Lentisphaeraceae bacterium]|nr:YdcF family protein [Lentisphaeraceae bacterium]